MAGRKGNRIITIIIYERNIFIVSFLAVALIAFAGGYIWGYTHAKFREDGTEKD